MKTIYKKSEDPTQILQASQDFNDVPVQQTVQQPAPVQQKAVDTGVLKTAQPIAKAQTTSAFDMTKWDATKPTYASDYADRIDALLDEVLNREAFSYDVESDPLYQQYQKQYLREGTRAMNDTMASLASGAGGMNSYALAAAQQANNYYNAQLGDRIPELAKLAYEMYLQDYNQDVNNLGLLRQQEQDAYGRYQDDLADWYAQLEMAYGQHRDSVADSQWQQSFDYNAQQDALAYQQWLEQMEYQKAQDLIAQQQWREQFDYGKQQDALAQQNWLAQMAYQKAQDALAQQNWQAQFDQNKAQADLDNQYRDDAFAWEKEQAGIDNQYRQDVFDWDKEQDNIANAKDYDRDAYDRAMDQVLLQMDGATEEQLAGLADLLTPSYPVTGSTGTPVVPPVAPAPAPKPDTPEVKPPRNTDGRTYDNGSLTREQVKTLQEYFGSDPDGLWGMNSMDSAGGLTADDAWAEYLKDMPTSYSEEPEKKTSKYEEAEAMVQYMTGTNALGHRRTSTDEEVLAYLDQFSEEELSEEELDDIMKRYNLGGYREG